MKKFKKPQAKKAYQHFLDNPGAKPISVAKRFKLSVPYAYKLRDQAAGTTVYDRDALVSDAELEALTTLPAQKQWTVKSELFPEDGGEDGVRTVNLEDLFPEDGVNGILNERARVYGAFEDNARVAQGLKRVMAEHARAKDRTFADDQWEALEMIASKISRIVNGNPDSVDQWDDIAGYATLIADRLRGVTR
jgi:hypothetical protein